MLMAHQQPQK